MDNNLENLIKELKRSGASDKEAQELAYLSKNLSNLYSFKRSDKVKDEFLDNLFKRKTGYASKRVFISIMLSLILLLGFSSVVFAQNSLPGDIFYPVKRLSENFAVKINPSFKNVVLQRRSEEINELTSKKKDIDKTVSDYGTELNENKKISNEAIKESKKNLEEASKNTIDSEHKSSIEKALLDTQRIEEKLDSEAKGEGAINKENNDNANKNDSINIQQNIEDSTNTTTDAAGNLLGN